MTETGNDAAAFPELFEVVRDYARGDHAHQVEVGAAAPFLDRATADRLPGRLPFHC